MDYIVNVRRRVIHVLSFFFVMKEISAESFSYFVRVPCLMDSAYFASDSGSVMNNLSVYYQEGFNRMRTM